MLTNNPEAFAGQQRIILIPIDVGKFKPESVKITAVEHDRSGYARTPDGWPIDVWYWAKYA